MSDRRVAVLVDFGDGDRAVMFSDIEAASAWLEANPDVHVEVTYIAPVISRRSAQRQAKRLKGDS